jgi:hypothetical protein
MTSKFTDLAPPGIHRSVVRLACSACGAEANASCNCGKPYVPARQRAVDAVAAHPEKSNRAIADDIGVSHETVRQARASTDNQLAVEAPRTGKDGKTRKLPSYRPPQAEAQQDDPSQDEDIIDQIINLFEQLSRSGRVRCAVQLREIWEGE